MIENKTGSFEIEDEILEKNSSGLDSDQIRAVKETKNVVVSAGAGSGKTTVLAARYAYLVEAKNVPSEKILTLTFTKKAATEMKDRIFNGLKNHLAGKDLKGKEEIDKNQPHFKEICERARRAIEKFDRTHIQTLDSYFSEIAKKGAHFYGINPNFALDNDKIRSLVNFKATKYVLEHLDCDEIKEISQVFEIQNVASDLFASSILDFSTVLTPIDFKKSLETQKNQILSDYENLTERISEEIASLEQNYSAANRKAKPSGTLLKFYSYLDSVGNPEIPSLTEKNLSEGNADVLTEYLQNVSGYCTSYFSQHLHDEFYKSSRKEILSCLEKLFLISNSVANFPLEEKIFAHLEKFQDDVNKTKRVSGILSFNDVSHLALKILTERAEIRTVEKQKFDAIMIDEFQDDNQLQCDVLLILCDKNEKFSEAGDYLLPRLSDSDLSERLDTHKLFFVGDDKQSIYRFRGADVSVFRNLSASIKNSIELKTNYRSDPELIKGFNSIFGGYDYPSQSCNDREVNPQKNAVFMTEKKFPAKIPDYEADYKIVEVPDFKQGDFSKKKITFAFYQKDDDEETHAGEDSASEGESDSEAAEKDRKNYECEASFVAREIKKLLSEKDGEGNQKYHYKDIALLFRSSGATSAYENVLLQNGIPYSTEVYKGFFSDGPVNDIISLLKLCVYPQDKNAYAKLLRSPFCGLDYAELEEVFLNTPSPYKFPFAPEMLEAVSENPVLRGKVGSLKKIYDEINSLLKTEKLTKTISYIWYELGYRYETLWNESVAMYSSFYDILFEMARLSEEKTQSLASFIDMVKSYEDSDKKLDGLDVVLSAEDAVQILTIHKSKGLEYKVVFVCASSAKSGGNDSKCFFEPNSGFFLKTPEWKNYQNAAKNLAKTGTIRKDNRKENYFSALLGEKNEKMESAELRRLAYVAFTRAEERLYVVGNTKGEYKEEEKSMRFSLHPDSKAEFTYTEATKNGDLKSKSAPYENPETFYQILLPILCDYENSPERDGAAFDFVCDAESFASRHSDESSLRACLSADRDERRSNLLEKLPDSSQMKPEEEALSPKIYVSPSKLGHADSETAGKSEKSENPGEYEGVPFSNPDYALINKIVASTIPELTGKIPELTDEGEEGEIFLENPDSENSADSDSNSTGAGSVDSADSEKPENARKKPLFGFTNFGTIAHAYLEGKVLGEEPKIHGGDLVGIGEKYIQGLDTEKWEGKTLREKKINKIFELCEDMAQKFESSDLYKEAKESSWKRTEYDFRSLVKKSEVGLENQGDYADEVIVKGQIDLVYKNPESSPFKYTIVDYKTNQKIEPEIYYAQLSCYRKAVSEMLSCEEKEIRCVLYYLRFAKEVEILG